MFGLLTSWLGLGNQKKANSDCDGVCMVCDV